MKKGNEQTVLEMKRDADEFIDEVLKDISPESKERVRWIIAGFKLADSMHAEKAG
ncbi:MAG: hypothetical protein ACI4EH_11600 [Oliverpabstia sp.]